jgi:hypothetical protein
MKSYFLTFGAIASSVQDVIKLLNVSFDIDFKQVGKFSKGSFYTTQVYVAENFLSAEFDWLELEDQEFHVIIYVHSAHGSNADKIALHKYLKNGLSQYDSITLLDEEVIEMQ